MNLNVAHPGFGVSLWLHKRCLICFLFSTRGFGSSRAGRVLMAASCARFFLFLAKPWWGNKKIKRSIFSFRGCGSLDIWKGKSPSRGPEMARGSSWHRGCSGVGAELQVSLKVLLPSGALERGRRWSCRLQPWLHWQSGPRGSCASYGNLSNRYALSIYKYPHGLSFCSLIYGVLDFYIAGGRQEFILVCSFCIEVLAIIFVQQLISPPSWTHQISCQCRLSLDGYPQ